MCAREMSLINTLHITCLIEILSVYCSKERDENLHNVVYISLFPGLLAEKLRAMNLKHDIWKRIIHGTI